MAIIKGGRGKKAPWDSVMVRTPEPIKSEVQALVDDWKRSQVDESYHRQSVIVSAEQARAIVTKTLRQKKSARVTVLAVLAELGLEVDL